MRPILFHLPFGLPLYAYGAMLCLSVIIGRLLAVRLAERAGMDARLMDRCCVWTLAAALIGARLLFVVTNLDQFDRLSNLFRWWDGGVVAYGGFLGGFLGAVGFCRIHRVRVLDWADCVAPSLCIGLVITRIGCFLFAQPARRCLWRPRGCGRRRAGKKPQRSLRRNAQEPYCGGQHGCPLRPEKCV